MDKPMSERLDEPLLTIEDCEMGEDPTDLKDEGITLAWQDVRCFIGTFEPKSEDADVCNGKICSRKILKRKYVMESISGHVAPGDVLALMGPSGSGKTTLLNLCGGREQLGAHGGWEGEILLNGRMPWKQWQRSLGFVMQKDIFYDTLTVHEELVFAANLRLPRNMSIQARQRRIAEVVKSVGLGQVLKTKIGSAVERGLSGGEAKRLSIAIELIADPSLLLLDEPLTGLDSTKATSVLQVLHDSAKQRRRSVMLSIHQPSSALFKLFDRLLILAPGGRRVFFGAASEAAAFFARADLPIPPKWNPTDHYIECVSNEETVERLLQLATCDSKTDRCHLNMRSATSAILMQSQSSLNPKFHTQVAALTRRSFTTSMDTILKPLNILLTVSLAAILGVLWFQLGVQRSHMSDHADDIMAVIFCVSGQWVWGPAFSVISTFPKDRDVLVKELASNTYSVEAYFVSKLITEIPVSAILPAVYYMVLWPLIGFPWVTLPLIYLVSLLVSFVSCSLAMMVSAKVFDTEKTITAVVIFLVFFMCTGGFFIDLTTQPPPLPALRFTSFWFYTMSVFDQILITAIDSDDHGLEDTIDETYSFSAASCQTNVGIALAYGVVFRIAAFLFLRNSPKLKFS